MLTQEERALITSLQDRMIELLVEKEEAQRRHDGSRAAKLQSEVDELKSECACIRDTGTSIN